MPNRYGQAYALTMLSPIIGGHTRGEVHATAIRSVLAGVPQGGGSPLARLGMLHVARLVVLDDLRIQGLPAREDHLRSKYLVFIADFDGDLDPFLEALVAQAADFVSAVWQHCDAFPGVTDRSAFTAYMKRCQITSTFAFGAYAKTPLPQVLRALDTQRRFMAFLRDAQGDSAAALQRKFSTFVQEVRDAPLPAPGTP